MNRGSDEVDMMLDMLGQVVLGARDLMRVRLVVGEEMVFRLEQAFGLSDCRVKVQPAQAL